MSERAHAGESIPELFEELAATADDAIAVVTAEDIGAPAVNSNGTSILAIDVRQLNPRARQNIWVEVGWFWGRLGRDRIMLLHRGDTDIPSDLGSIIRQEYKDDPSERIDELGKFVDGLKQ